MADEIFFGIWEKFSVRSKNLFNFVLDWFILFLSKTDEQKIGSFHF